MKFGTRTLFACAAGAALSLSLFCAAPSAAEKPFTLTSPQLKDGGVMGTEQVFNAFGCTGKNISPELVWSDPPKGTKKGRWSGALFWYKRNAFRLSQGEIHRFSGSISWVVTMFTLPLLSRIHAQTKISAVATTVPMASGSVRLVREKKPVISEVMMDTTIRNR